MNLYTFFGAKLYGADAAAPLGEASLFSEIYLVISATTILKSNKPA